MAERHYSLEGLSQAQRDLNPDFVAVTFCYLCNAKTLTPRWDPPWDNRTERLDPQGQLDRNFIEVGNLDIYPIACEQCDSAYKTLPTPSYFMKAVPLYPSVGYQAPFLHFGDGRPEFDQREKNGSQRPRLEPLYQEWLFFGTLEFFLGDLYDRAHFIHRSELGDEVVVIDPLLTILPDWVRLKRQTANDRQAAFTHFNQCLTHVRQMLRLANLGLDEDLRCLIATMGEILSRAMIFSFPESEYTEQLSQGFSAFKPRSSLVTRLKQLGWCKYDATKFLTLDRTLSELSLYMNLDRSSIRSLHQECTESKCEEHDIQMEQSTQRGPSHFDCSGACLGANRAIRFNSTEQEKMVAILNQNEIPLVQIEVDPEGNAISIAVEKATKDRDYVAISHVWSQGLGNHNDNSLMQCQLTRLHRLLNSFRNISRRGIKPLLWIDTLCCPVRDRDARKAAIKLMEQTYRNAKAVIILDTELERYEISKSAPLELCARVFTSAWMGRLWTLQEGAEPPQLWIKFADRILNVFSMFLALRSSCRSTDLRERLIAVRMLSNYLNIRLYQTISRETRQGEQMIHLASALEHRRVWKPTDEALCLGNLLRLDMDRLFGGSEDMRMQRLWDQISECGLISRELVFYAGSKMNVPGYRWALTTLLQNGANNAFLWSRVTPARATTEGLEISSRGGLIDLSTGTVQPHIQDDVLQVRESNGQRRKLFPMDEAWEEHLQLPFSPRPTLGHLLQDAKKRFALLPHHANGCENNDGNSNCLLVEIIGSMTEIVVCLGKRLVGLELYSQEQSVALDADGIAFHGTITQWLPPTQLWRID